MLAANAAVAARIMTPPKKILGIAFVLAVFAHGLPASADTGPTTYPACTKTVTTGESELAHQKYIAAKQDYDEGNYDSAIRRFRDAYTLDCTKHELLIIISAAYERRGDKKEAIAALETYVNRASSAPDVGTYQAKIENLKRQVAATPPAPAATTPSTPAPAPSTTPPPEHSALPWIAVGIGGAAIVAGAVILATTPRLPEGCRAEDSSCATLPGEPASNSGLPNPALDARREQAGKHVDQPGVGLLVMGAGALVAVGGVIWHFLEPTSKDAAKVHLTPGITPGYAGLSLGGGF
jgi:hypothetical protein